MKRISIIALTALSLTSCSDLFRSSLFQDNPGFTLSISNTSSADLLVAAAEDPNFYQNLTVTERKEIVQKHTDTIKEINKPGAVLSQADKELLGQASEGAIQAVTAGGNTGTVVNNVLGAAGQLGSLIPSDGTEPSGDAVQEAGVNALKELFPTADPAAITEIVKDFQALLPAIEGIIDSGLKPSDLNDAGGTIQAIIIGSVVNIISDVVQIALGSTPDAAASATASIISAIMKGETNLDAVIAQHAPGKTQETLFEPLKDLAHALMDPSKVSMTDSAIPESIKILAKLSTSGFFDSMFPKS